MKPHRGGEILVLVILGLMMCPPVGIFAWFMGSEDLEKMRHGNMDSSGRDLTNAGRILGIVGTIYFFVVAVMIIMLVVGASLKVQALN